MPGSPALTVSQAVDYIEGNVNEIGSGNVNRGLNVIGSVNVIGRLNIAGSLDMIGSGSFDVTGRLDVDIDRKPWP